MSDLLTVRNLCKSYPSGNQRLEVLVNLSLDVAEREMVAITGVSGSGKSTLLHLLGGMDRPDGGTITIQGVELSRLKREELCRFRNQTIGFVFQFHHLLPEFTALENVLMPLLLRGEARDRAEALGRKALDEVGLAGGHNPRPGDLWEAGRSELPPPAPPSGKQGRLPPMNPPEIRKPTPGEPVGN